MKKAHQAQNVPLEQPSDTILYEQSRRRNFHNTLIQNTSRNFAPTGNFITLRTGSEKATFNHSFGNIKEQFVLIKIVEECHVHFILAL